MSRDEMMYLRDIAQSCRKVLQFTEGLSQNDLLGDVRTYDAVVRNMEIIGEAAKHISDEMREQLADIEWRKIAGLRDMLAHVYFGIDDDILWDVVKNRIPELVRAVEKFLSEHEA
jgi:uncharacterized protein with HEPN domain